MPCFYPPLLIINHLMYDSHSHIQFKAYQDDRDEVIKKCIDKNMTINVIGTQYKTSKDAIALAEKYDNFYATVGLHPIQTYSIPVKEENTSFVSIAEEFDVKKYTELAKHPKVIAIGETGLDRFHIPDNKTTQEIMSEQIEVFMRHHSIAKELDLPLVIHVRDPKKNDDGTLPASTHVDMIKVLQDIGEPINGVIHCFSGNWQEAQQYLALGLHLGFTGVVTYKPKKLDPQPQLDLLEVVDKMPLDRMLVETDSPYLAPQAYRGKRCEPWMVEEVISFIAERRGVSVGELDEVTEGNGKRLFNIK